MRWKILVLVLVVVISLLGAVIAYEMNACMQNIVAGTGTVVFLSFEGGFTGIIGDNGEHYDPINWGPEFKVVDGMRVFFIAKILPDRFSFHMWGRIVEMLYIQKI